MTNQAPLTFGRLMLRERATPEERIACAHFLAQQRHRRTIEHCLPQRRCFTYCGDDKCDCDARPAAFLGAQP